MSLSKIIKLNDQNSMITECCFGFFGEDAVRGTVRTSPFLPYSFVADAGGIGVVNEDPFQRNGHQGEATDSPLPVGMLVSGISEEEVEQKVRDAFEKGLQEGQLKAEGGMAKTFTLLDAALEELTQLRQKILNESEDDLLNLALAVARKVIRQEVSQDRRILAGFIAEAVKCAADKDAIVIRLNPEDYKAVTAHRQLYLPELREEQTISLKSEEGVESGGCVVETVMGSIDAGIGTQLDEIYRRLVEERSVNNEPVMEMPTEGGGYVTENS